MCEPDALRLAIDQELDDVHIDERHFTQIEHKVWLTVSRDGSAQVRQVL